jgi:type I restriction enzyme R subunit
MTLLTEKRDVQDQLINHLIGIGWRYLPPGDVAAERGGDERQPFLPAVARQQLIALNPSTSRRASPGLVTEANADDVLRRLHRVHPSLAGNEAFLKALRGNWTVYDPAEKRERNLTLIDFDHPDRNDFTFTQELPFVDRDRRRMDVVLFVNGLPVVVVENKSPALPEAELEAFEQVQRVYTECIPEFLKFVQFFAACDRHLHYGPTWNDDLKAFYRWKADGKDYGLERLSKTLFDRAGLLRILQDYLIFFRADDQTHKYILRPHQMRAAERVVQRVAEGVGADLASSPTTGLIWHTQGSGKTLTMIVAAHQLRRLEGLENPTILVVVDRRELETQMVQNLEAFGFPMVEQAASKQRLRRLLASDYRGLIVTLVQKFDRIPKNLNRRNNIVVLVDEAHRSQEGDLAVYMRAALPNAFYFGFTGTPVDRGRIGRGTFETFGKADPGGYQDKYGIDESIEDKTTVPLYYTLAPSELRLDRETLEEEFYRLVDEVGVASQEELNRLLDKAEKLKAVLKAPARVEAIAAHVAKHFRENVEPLGFKAFLVAVDREACALYKEALDSYLPAEYSQVVYTPDHKDRELLRQYHLDDAAEKQVRKAFRDPTRQPEILIVTEKLLTGYDAPVLYAMYLDKPLKDHTLLQAIARVNRPYPAKESGLIVDYIGIFEDLQRALAFDQAEISRALIDLVELKQQFAGLMEKVEAAIAPIDLLGDHPDRPARIIERFFDPDRREAFIQDFRALQTAYEIISPDPFLRDYLARYALVAQVYRVVYDEFDPEAGKRRMRYDLLRKTDALIRENVDVVYLASPLPHYRINRDLAHVIAADGVSDQVKVINLYRSLMAHVQANQGDQPYLVSIGEEVEAIIRRLRERQISVQMALRQIQAKAEEAVQAEAEQRRSHLPGKAFAFLWVLRGYGIPDAEAKAREIEGILDAYPGWPYNQKIEQAVRFALHRALWDPVKGAAQRTEAVNNLLKMHRTVMG